MIDLIENPAVAVYTTPGCVQCKATFRWLDKHDYPYTEIDVSTDIDASDYVRGMGYSAAPVVVLSTGEHWSGFDPTRLEKHLG